MSIETHADLRHYLRTGRGGRRPLTDTQIRLVLAARDLFYRFGVKAVSVEVICAEAHASKPSVYHFFKSKDELLLTCVTAEADLLCLAMQSVVKEAGPDLGDRLAGLMSFFTAEMGRDQYRGLFLSNVALEFPDPEHPVRVAAARAADALHGLLMEIVRPAAGEEAAQVARHLQLLIYGAAAAAASLGGRWVPGALDEAVAQTTARLSVGAQ